MCWPLSKRWTFWQCKKPIGRLFAIVIVECILIIAIHFACFDLIVFLFCTNIQSHINASTELVLNFKLENHTQNHKIFFPIVFTIASSESKTEWLYGVYPNSAVYCCPFCCCWCCMKTSLLVRFHFDTNVFNSTRNFSNLILAALQSFINLAERILKFWPLD